MQAFEERRSLMALADQQDVFFLGVVVRKAATALPSRESLVPRVAELCLERGLARGVPRAAASRLVSDHNGGEPPSSSTAATAAIRLPETIDEKVLTRPLLDVSIERISPFDVGLFQEHTSLPTWALSPVS